MNDNLPIHFARLKPRSGATRTSQSRCVLITDPNGVIEEGQHGLFVYQTRVLSRYQYLVDGRAPEPNVLSNVKQHSWIGYYIASSPKDEQESRQGVQSSSEKTAEQTIELRLSRFIGDGMHEDVDVTNYTQQRVSVSLELEVDADFADQVETKSGRRQHGELTRQWEQIGDAVWQLVFNYQAQHTYDHQGDRGTARLHRGLTLRIARCDTPPSWHDGRLAFRLDLPPHGTWHACVDAIPMIDGQQLHPLYGCRSFDKINNERDRRRIAFLRESTHFSAGPTDSLAPVVVGALEQAKQDLAALRLYDLDRGERTWTMAAGLPLYVALFGRDTLTVGWETGLASTALMEGALAALSAHPADRVDRWRDELPGRLLHQMDTGPLAALDFTPLGLYYGTVTAPTFFPMVLGELWHWIGDKQKIAPYVETALNGLRSMDRYNRWEDNGFYFYQTLSDEGLKNQAWKDSGDAIVDEAGSIVEPPIATCEQQAYTYIAKVRMAEILWWLDRREEADRLTAEAAELKKRFNEAFWMDDKDYFAMGLDSHRKQIRSEASGPGHCIAAGCIDDAFVSPTANRLLSDDLFSGWGIRTLSTRNPAFDPYSYHRGSVWPVEQGIIAMGFYRYGLHEYVERLCRALFEAAALFEFYRLPECFSGHPRDADHPIPAIHPHANWPQAWSSSAVISLMQAMLGLYPYAPLNILFVDPHLPPWLPEITLHHLRVGPATATLHFFRDGNGQTDYEVIKQEGVLHILHQPTPWSLTAGYGERFMDAITSLVPGR